MTTLLSQLKFIFDSMDEKTDLIFDENNLTLHIPDATNTTLVQRIASKMGIPSTFGNLASINLHLALPLKENDVLPETDFQRSVNKLIHGHGNIMGLKELSLFMFHSWRYSGSQVYHKLSTIETAFLKASGWDLDFHSGLSQVKGKVILGPDSDVNRSRFVQNDNLQEFLEHLLFTEPLYNSRVSKERLLLCGWGSQFPHAVDERNNRYKAELLKVHGFGHSFSDLLAFFMNNTLVFPNGQRIRLRLSEKYSSSSYKDRQDFLWDDVPASTSARWEALMMNVSSGSDVQALYDKGVLAEFLDLGECVCEPRTVEFDSKKVSIIRSALASYMEDGAYPGFKHAVVGDSLQVWLSKDTDNTSQFTPSKIRRTRKAFEEAVNEATQTMLASYDGKYTFVR